MNSSTDTADSDGSGYLHRALCQVRAWATRYRSASPSAVVNNLQAALVKFNRVVWRDHQRLALFIRATERQIQTGFDEGDLDDVKDWLKPLIAGRAAMDVMAELESRGMGIQVQALRQQAGFPAVTQAYERLLQQKRNQRPELIERLEAIADQRREEARDLPLTAATAASRRPPADAEWRNPR